MSSRYVSSMVATLALVIMLASPAPSVSEAAPVAPSARDPLAKVLGIGVGTSEARAHRLLRAIGAEVKLAEAGDDEEGSGLERELWNVTDARFDWILLAIDSHGRVRALQAHARPKGPGLRYEEIGDLGGARLLGYTIYEWKVPARSGTPGRRVTARGQDSMYTDTIAITAD